MSEEFKDNIEDLKDRLNDLENRIIELEERATRKEEYKIFLYPKTIFNYISNLINLQAKEEGSDQYYPANEGIIQDYFNDEKFNPGSINPEKIKYNHEISYNDLMKICQLISYQGISGFNFLDKLENEIELNKPIILYYGVLQLGVFYTNLHFNFTPYNRTLSSFRRMSKHGIDHNEIDRIEFYSNEVLTKKIKLKKIGVAMKFFLAYDSNLLRFFLEEKEFSLINLLENYFWEKGTIVRNEFKSEFGYREPTDYFRSMIFSIYLISFFMSILSRYKMHVWTKLLESQKKKISYFIKYFLKFAKDDFLTLIFENLRERRSLIPEIASMSSNMLI